jgi:phosphoribosylformylglycinamidine cyclo-ligase
MAVDPYKEAGVDIEAAARLVDRISPLAKATSRAEVLGGLGHFGSMWHIPAGRFRDLVLVSGTDGVGTKVKVAQAADRHDGIGIDLVAMCVNDVICTGAEPFFFLDYFACGTLNEDVAATVIGSVAEGCRLAGAALVGGETAEMPGVYGEGVYDLAGFCVGGVEREDVIESSRVRLGMKAIGLASSGLHSNGYSLARKIVFEKLGLALTDPFPGADHDVATELITPTRIYVQAVLRTLREHSVGGICHITGGGFQENLPRVLPEGASIVVDRASWTLPNVFKVLQEGGGLSDTEVLRTFNSGIGMVLLVESEEAAAACELLTALGEEPAVIGEVTERDGSDGAQVLFA